MLNNEYELIMKHISSGIESGNLKAKDLRKLKKYIQMGMCKISTIESFDEKTVILLKSVPEFIKENFSLSERRGTQLVHLCNAILRLNDLKLDEVRVYNMIGLTPKMISIYGYKGTKTLETFETKLNQYGLSMSQKLLPDQIVKIEEIINKNKKIRK